MINKKNLFRALRNKPGKGEENRQSGKNYILLDDEPNGKIVYTKTRLLSPSDTLMDEHRVLPAQKGDSITNAFEFLRTQVLFRMQEQGWNVLAVTSPGEGEGKTLTAINLAISISKKLDTTILLVDANLKNPMVHRCLGLDPSEGLIDYIVNGTPIEKLLIHPDIDRLTLLPGGEPVEKGAELITSPKMLALVEELKHRYRSRIIMFDLPPLLSKADALAFSPYIDCILLVVKAGTTQKQEVERALRLLEGTPVIGTVLNQG